MFQTGCVDVWRAAQLYGAGNPDGIDSEVVTMLIRGLVEALPERAAGYLTAEQVPEAQEQLGRLTEGSYVGIGSRVGISRRPDPAPSLPGLSRRKSRNRAW